MEFSANYTWSYISAISQGALFSTEYDKSLRQRTSRIDGTPCRCAVPRYGLARDRCRGCLTFLARREIYGQSSVSRPGKRAEKKGREEGTRATGAPNAAKLITVPLRAYVHTDKARSSEVDPRRRRQPRRSLSPRTHLIANVR